ncbi:SDR family NAD(P)-dependent oxidoreductase [Streptomyces sp. NPDC055775]
MKVAIVTGASSGIGRSAAIEIAKSGNGVILTYGTNAQGGLETAAIIEKEGGTTVTLPLDAAKRAPSRCSATRWLTCCATPGSATPSTIWSTTPVSRRRR